MAQSSRLTRLLQPLVLTTALAAFGCGDSEGGDGGSGGSASGGSASGGSASGGSASGGSASGGGASGGSSGSASAWNVAVTGALDAMGSGTITNTYGATGGVTCDGDNASGTSASIHATVASVEGQPGVSEMRTLVFTLDDGTECDQTFDVITNHGFASATVNDDNLDSYDVDFSGWADCDGAGEVEVTGSFTR